MQVHNWVFGNQLHFDFSTSPPTVDPDFTFSTGEGSAILNDNITGALLAYSDGYRMYNAQQHIMPNGDSLSMGSWSNTQAAMIVPWPGHDKKYFVFTSSYVGSGPLFFALLDMILDSGRGAIVTKRNVLMNNTEEKLAAIMMCDGSGYWLVAHSVNTNDYYAYPITSGGIGAPVISSVGLIHNDPNHYDAQGALQFSSDGRYLAAAMGFVGHWLEIYRFNAQTGVISDPLVTKSVGYSSFNYGVVFSPNNRWLYVSSEYPTLPTHRIYQYDLTVYDSASVFGSATLVASNSIYSFRGLQLAEDRKIYVAADDFYKLSNLQQSYVHTINDPDSAGLNCNFQLNAIRVDSGQNRGFTWLGVPYFVQSYVGNSVYLNLPDDTTLCQGFLDLSGALCYPSYLWSTGSTGPTTIIPSTGWYWLQVSNGIYSTTDSIYVALDTSTVSAFTTTTLNDTAIFSNNSTNATSWFWDFGDGDTSTLFAPTHIYTSSGFYTVMLITSNACSSDTSYYSFNVLITGTEESQGRIPEIYPNPVSDNLIVNVGASMINSIAIYDSYGQIVYESVMNTNYCLITTANFSDGIYSLAIRLNDGKTFSEKFTVIHE